MGFSGVLKKSQECDGLSQMKFRNFRGVINNLISVLKITGLFLVSTEKNKAIGAQYPLWHGINKDRGKIVKTKTKL